MILNDVEIPEHFVYLKILKKLKNWFSKGGSLDNAIVVKNDKF